MTGLPVRFLFYSFIVVIIGILLTGVISFLFFFSDFQSKERLVDTQNTGLLLLDRTGKAFFSFGRNRSFTYIPISNMPPSLQQAAISAEDKNFYKDPGFSLSGTTRALFVDAMSGTTQQGGSGVSQQLIKNTLLSPQKSISRKYEELVLSYLLNLRFSKQDILEMYLNTAYFGEGTYGVEDAAKKYFGVSAKNLTPGESALLIGLLPSPASYSPLSNDPNIAKQHQEEVLSQMVQNKFITQKEANDAKDEALVYNTSPQQSNLNTYGTHFALMVRDELYKKYGENSVNNSGFTVITTLNSSMQEYSENVVENQVAKLYPDNATNGAAVIIDPKTGQILSFVGSHNWDNPINGKIDMAITPRQPGSSFKPVVYSQAFSERLITPSTILQDIPTNFPGNYKPKDYDGHYRGPVTVRRALANSLNIPSVEVMQKVGVPDVLSQAQNLGITTLSDPSQYGLSLVLGSGQVKLLELTNVYATFANNGVYNQPIDVLQIKDKYGNIINSYEENSRPAVDPGVAFLISSILSDNRTRAEEFGNLLTIDRPAAVKTGTTEDFRDALTFGYTPYLTIGVWVGNNNNAPMDNIAGSLGAAPIWKQLMEHFSTSFPKTAFFAPPDIEKLALCPTASLSSGHSATSSAYEEYFLAGTEPNGSTCSFPTLSPPNLTPSETSSPTVSPTEETPSESPSETPIPSENTPSPTQQQTVILQINPAELFQNKIRNFIHGD